MCLLKRDEPLLVDVPPSLHTYLAKRRWRLVANVVLSLIGVVLLLVNQTPGWYIQIIFSIVSSIVYSVALWFWNKPGRTRYLTMTCTLIISFLPLIFGLFYFDPNLYKSAITIIPALARAAKRIPNGGQAVILAQTIIKLIIVSGIFVVFGVLANIADYYGLTVNPTLFIVFPFVVSVHFIINHWITGLPTLGYLIYLLYLFEKLDWLVLGILNYLWASVGFEDMITLILEYKPYSQANLFALQRHHPTGAIELIDVATQ